MTFVHAYVTDTKFYVLVSQLNGKGYIFDLCGKLWASNSQDAVLEAQNYSEELNTLPIEWVGDDWYLVRAIGEKHARQLKVFKLFKSNRVTRPIQRGQRKKEKRKAEPLQDLQWD